jgi:phosphatidate cytidylyltransferase
MLKTRVMTALVIAPIGLLLVFFLPFTGFQLVVGLLLLAGTWEYHRLADLNRFSTILLLLLQSVILLLLWLYWTSLQSRAMPVLAAACLTWCLMLLRLATFRNPETPGQFVDISYRILGFFCALASITFAWFSLSWLRSLPSGEFWIMLLLLTIWAADIGAYFSGRTFGKHKLAKNISPGKTREGVLGGLVLSSAVLVALTHLIPGTSMSVLAALLTAILTVIVSVGGDLFISLQKRSVGIKDTGSLFPGHGGMLDRFDSLLSGAPFFALAVWLFST